MGKSKIDAQAVIELLSEKFPRAFVVYERRRRPLKVGIHEDLVIAAAGAITAREICVGLRAYTSDHGYLKSCKEGAARLDLNGEACGTVTKDETQYAKKRLMELMTKHAQRQAAKKVAPKKITPPSSAATATTGEPPPRRDGLQGLREAARSRRQREMNQAPSTEDIQSA